MATKTKATTATVDSTGDRPAMPITLGTLQFLRTAKGKSDKEIHSQLDNAFRECKTNSQVLLLERIMLHIGDVSRQHNMLKELGINSKTGGAQERAIFRSCMRWWEKNIPSSFKTNLHIFVEFTLYENLMYFQNTTDRKSGKLLGSEILFPCPAEVHALLCDHIRTGKNLNLIAKHLPKYSASKNRVTKLAIKAMKTKTEFLLKDIKLPEAAWFKVNGQLITDKNIVVKVGDIISYPRKKQQVTLDKQVFVNGWIKDFCDTLDWSIENYNEFRMKQNTPEQKFSSLSVKSMPKSDFMLMLDMLTSGQRFRVAKTVAYKDEREKLHAKDKWGDLGNWYIEWESNQTKIAEVLRTTTDPVKKEALAKDFKVKAVGVQTIDMLVDLFKGTLNHDQINNTYQAMVEKMDLVASVFPIVDGSGSMDNTINYNGVRISYRALVYAMCITFSTKNPIEEFRNSFGWFSSNFYICGRSKYVDERPNPFLAKTSFSKQVPEYQILSETKTFTENLKAITAADPKDVSSTNMFSSIEYFVKLVQDGKTHVEDLPNALLYLTDNENNAGKTPKQAIELANSIGWRPLLVFWGISGMSDSTKRQMEGVPNCLFVGGFNEGVLSQILRGIKSGSVNPETELWSLYEDVRYSVLK